MAKLVLMGIGSVHKCQLQSPHMLVQTRGIDHGPGIGIGIGY